MRCLHNFSVSLSLFQNGKFIFESMQVVSIGIPPNKVQAHEKVLMSVVRRETQQPRHGPRDGWNRRDRWEPCWWACREVGALRHTGGLVT